MKKEHVETIHDSFVDYAGKTHHFVIAAISQVLPQFSGQLKDNPAEEEDLEVNYDVQLYIEDFGDLYVGSVNKVLLLGVSICNPVDTFDEKIGIAKAVARARNSKPVLYASNKGVINTHMVKALLEQEAGYLKNNPENFIYGYAEARDRYQLHKEMENIKNNLSEEENQILERMQKNPNFLDNVMKFFNWFRK